MGGETPPARVRPRWRRRGLVLALLAVLILLVSAALLAPGWLAGQAVAALEARLGGQVTLELAPSVRSGPGLDVQAFRWRPSEGDDAIRVASVRVETDWLAHDGVRHVRVHMADARIELHQTPDGRWRLPVPETAETGEGTDIALAGVDIQGLQLKLFPRAMGPVEMRVEQATATPDGDGWQLALDGELHQDDRRWAGRLQARLVPAGEGMVVEKLRLEGTGQAGVVALPSLTLSAGPLRVDAGRVELDTAQVNARVQVAATPPLEGTLSARLGAAQADATGFQATIEALMLNQTAPMPASLTLEAMRARLAAGRLELAPLRGQLRVTRSGAAYAVEAQDGRLGYGLESGRVDLADARWLLRFPDPKASAETVGAMATLSGAGAPADGRASGQLRVILADSTMDAEWTLDRAQIPPLSVVAQVDRLDLDRWLAKAGGDTAPAPLAAWRDWPLRARLQVGRLTWQGVTVSGAQVTLGQDVPAASP